MPHPYRLLRLVVNGALAGHGGCGSGWGRWRLWAGLMRQKHGLSVRGLERHDGHPDAAGEARDAVAFAGVSAELNAAKAIEA